MQLNYRKIGESLAKRRKELKLRQYEVCERADINYKYLSNIETARSIPSLEIFVRLCQALETTPDQVLEGSLPQTDHSAEDEALLQVFHSLSLDDQRLCLDFMELLHNRLTP